MRDSRCVPVLLLAALLVTALGCSPSSSPEGAAAPQKLVITGSSTVAPLVGEIAKRFEAQNPGIRIDVQTGGSSRGLADARRGVADIGMVSRAPKPGEDDLQWFQVATDGLAIILQRDNPVAELTREQVIAIYRGTIENWSEVGGADAAITTINKAEGRSTLEVFLDHFELESSEVVADVVVGDNQQGIKLVSSDPDAIGYVSIGAATYEAKRGIAIKLLPADGVPATIDSVRQELYPLARQLNVVAKPPVEGLVERFIAYCRSAEVHDIVEAQYFVPVAG